MSPNAAVHALAAPESFFMPLDVEFSNQNAQICAFSQDRLTQNALPATFAGRSWLNVTLNTCKRRSWQRRILPSAMAKNCTNAGGVSPDKVPKLSPNF